MVIFFKHFFSYDLPLISQEPFSDALTTNVGLQDQALDFGKFLRVGSQNLGNQGSAHPSNRNRINAIISLNCRQSIGKPRLNHVVKLQLLDLMRGVFKRSFDNLPSNGILNLSV